MKHKTRHLACALLTTLVAAAPASADVTVEGTGEPAFISSSNNTQWIRWPAGTSRLRVQYVVDGVLRHEETITTAASGAGWVNWSGVPGVALPLQEGSHYGICVRGYWFDGTLHFPDMTTSCTDGAARGLRVATVIDRTKPVLTVAPQDGEDAVRDPQLRLRIGYDDARSNPFPATFTCVRTAADPASECGATGQLAYDAGCSVPAAPSARQTHFDCMRNLPAATPDGPVTFCASGADSSVPDRPSSADQSASASEANISARACTTLLLDRSAPELAIAGSGSAAPGEALGLATAASDALAGLEGEVEWKWGDGATASGPAASHAYAAPGSYTVTATARDRAGNVATAQHAVTVKAATPQAPSEPQPQSPAPAGPQAPAVPAAPVAAELRLQAPKRLTLKRKAKLAVALTTNGAGSATVALVRSGRVHLRKAVAIGGAGTRALRLALPRGLRPGSYRLEVAYRSAGGAATASARIGLRAR